MIKLCLDNQNFNKKPCNMEIKYISNKIAKMEVELHLEDFARAVVQPYGRSYCGALFIDNKRSNATWKSQQVFSLDIDSGLTIKEALNRCEELNLFPAFIYTTFSSSLEHEKFRMVYVINEEITDIRIRELVQKSLMRIFNETDRSTKDGARLLFGGQKIVYSNYENYISVPQLIFAVSTVIKSGKNSTRDMDNFCRYIGVDILNGNPNLRTFDSESELVFMNNTANMYISMTKNNANIINIKRSCGKNSHENYAIYFAKDNTKEYYINALDNISDKFKIEKTKEKISVIRNYCFENLESECKLYRESLSGRYWLYHNEMFGLMTSLLHIQGGSEKIDQILNSRAEYNEKIKSWNVMANQISKMNYKPCNCESFCPFESKCNHCKNIIEQGKLIRGRIMKSGSAFEQEKNLIEAREELNNIFNNIISNNESGIFVIKAPTGIGKTELYVNACKGLNLTIAVPTHRLINEVSDRMAKVGVRHLALPELPEMDNEIRTRLEHLYDIGAFKSANKYLREVSKEVNNMDIEEYIAKIDRSKTIRNMTIITTHQRLLHSKDFNDIVVIDEDIMKSLFPQSRMTIGDFNIFIGKIMNSSINEKTRRVLKSIQQQLISSAYEVIEKTLIFEVCEDADLIENIVANDDTINTNILEFLNSSHFIKVIGANNKEYVYFIGRKRLPNKKIIILSASINERIAKIVFGEAVKFYNLDNIKAVGNIIQITNKSYSRYSINKNKEEMLDYANILIETFNPGSKIISYKNYKELDYRGNLWFGNTLGLDILKGQNITIVGTPNMNPIYYILLSSALGFEPRLNESKVEFLPVTRGRYKFYFNTYGKNDFLQEIQFYLIESELLQAVGRARPLTEPVKVLVLSNFPVQGAEYIYLSKQQIEKIIKKVS